MNTEEKGPAEVDGTNPEEQRYTTAEEMNPMNTPKALNVQLPLSEMIRLRLFVVADQYKGTPKGEEVAQVIDTLRGIAQLQVLPKEGGGITYKWNTRKGFTHEQTKAALSTSWVYITVCWLFAIPTGQPDVDESLRTLREKESERYPITVPGETPEADAMAEELGRRGFAVSRTVGHEQHDQQDGPEEPSTLNVNPDEKGLIRVSQAYVTNAHGGANLFTAMESAKLPDLPDIGLELNATETAVCHAAITMFHDTNYRGNGMISLVDSFTQQGIEHPDRLRSESMARRATDGYPGIPFVRFTLAEMTRRAGMNPDRGGDRDKVKAAIVSLKDRRFYFSWERPKQARGDDGIWRSVTTGERERITHEGPLFTMSTATDIRTLGDGGADIQLHATAVLLDQVNDTFGGSNYVMIPRTLVDDIRKARPTKGKRGGLVDHTYRFLVYLHEKVKKRGKKTGWTLRLDEAWQDIARIVKLPPSVIATQGPRAQAALLEIYSTAKALGYLSNFERITSGKAAYRRGIRDILTVDARAFQPKGSDTSADSSPKALPEGGISDRAQHPEKRGPGRGEKRPGKRGRPRG